MALILCTDGSRVALDVRGELSLKQMQQAVGGYIEVVYVGSPTDTPNRRTIMIVNEDGLRLRLAVNQAATRLYRGTPPRHDGIIVGDAILATLVLTPGDEGPTERIV